jgi:hypothetical protein
MIKKRTKTDQNGPLKYFPGPVQPPGTLPRSTKDLSKAYAKAPKLRKSPNCNPISPISFFKIGALRFLSLRNDKKTDQNGPKRTS